MANLKRIISGSVVFLVVITNLAADAQWPPNHSRVYASARFPDTHPSTIAGNKPPDLPALVACSPLEIFRSGTFAILTDDGGIQRWLAKKEDWHPLLHATKQECDDYVQAHGLPRVVGYTGDINHGNTFRIVPSATEGAK